VDQICQFIKARLLNSRAFIKELVWTGIFAVIVV
jgi:hypothetical protein